MTERDRPEPVPACELDEALGEVTLFGESWTLRLAATLDTEPYHRSRRAELVPLAAERGMRTVVIARPYILIPHYGLAIDLSPSPLPGAVGTVTESRWEGMQREVLGQATGWYYDADRVLVLWEAVLEDRFRAATAASDATLATIWQGFERLLRDQFPAAQTLVTGATDPLYAPDDYAQFLRQQGYTRLSERAFSKADDG